MTLKAATPSVLRFFVCVSLLFVGFMLCGWIVLGPFHPKVIITVSMVIINTSKDWLTDGMSLFFKFIHWLTDWLVTNWLLTDWQMTEWLTDWLDWLTDWLADWLTAWLLDCLMDWLTDRLIDWLIDWQLTEWLSNWLGSWLRAVTEWQYERLLTDKLITFQKLNNILFKRSSSCCSVTHIHCRLFH